MENHAVQPSGNDGKRGGAAPAGGLHGRYPAVRQHRKRSAENGGVYVLRHPQMLPLLRGVHCLYTRIMVPQGGAEPSVSCRPAPASRRQFVRSCRRLYFLPFNRGQVSFSSTQRCRGYVPFVMTVHFEKAVGSRMPSPLLPGKRHAALRLFTYKRARSGGVCRRLFAVPVGRGRPAFAGGCLVEVSCCSGSIH